MQAHPLSTPAARNIPFNPLAFAERSDPLPLADGRGLAHDAGNLLAALGLYCDLLDAPGVLLPQHLHYARELRSLSLRSGSLIRRLLSDGTASPLPAPPETVDAAGTLLALEPLLRAIASPVASVRLHLGQPLPSLPFPAEILERILINLTRNAANALAQHPPQAGPPAIHIAAAEIGSGGLTLTIADNGPGLSTTAAASFVSPRPLPRGATTGMGHRIVHHLLASTGGTLSISAARLRGTTIQLTWPAAPPPPARSRAGSEASC